MLRCGFEFFNGFGIGLQHISGEILGDDAQFKWMIILDIACVRFFLEKMLDDDGE